MLFSYVILCDFFPLYNFQSDKCLIGTEENLNTDMFVFLSEKISSFNSLIILLIEKMQVNH